MRMALVRTLLLSRLVPKYINIKSPLSFPKYSQNVHAPRNTNTIRKWKYVPIGFGLSVAALTAIWYPSVPKPSDWELLFYSALPLKTVSRLWGWLNTRDLPESLRTPLLGLYVRTFGCNMEEAEVEELKAYSNLQELFRRALKSDARTVCPISRLVSPCDGKVLSVGRVSEGEVQQVKGLTYSLKEFLGLEPRENQSHLYQVTIYLAPGDYHRFHSPANWDVSVRRHFPGYLFSVSPGIVGRIKGLFNLNERVAYVGEWSHGFFSMTPVGATNVGSIKIYFDDDLETNLKRKATRNYVFSQNFTESIKMKKGSPFGEFNLGSTVVLVFELPSSADFSVQSGDRVKMGQALLKL